MTGRMAALAGNGTVHVLFAFAAMGGWATFANRAHPMPAPLVAGLIQGTLSACLTLLLKSTVDLLSKRFSGISAYVAPPLIACLASGSVLTGIHVVSGTPEILKTIAVPLIVSTSYAALYTASLARKRS